MAEKKTEVEETAQACCASGECELTAEERLAKAEDIVRKHMLVALGTGIIPPIIDIAALTGIQIRMLYVLAEAYNIKFKEEAGKSVIGTVIAGYGMANIATGAVHSLMKFIPGIGTISGAASLSVVASASTYALGKVFIQHFESGGTMLDFDPDKMRDYYYEQYKKGTDIAKKEQSSK